ncbi:Glycosyltransferase involved in cell wall bisynthesis [Bacteroides luti]|uniref:Glycosyltransferase involved in cell wall bisynthesis n=1 Tax=Bacteroides luti TaxID=1297750 RepID=A0A1M4WIS4_9BACE|nr:glycosyltransferase [Bacteroides luti]SHE81050.1 Glycosyltransferase involved in cell wall bisynthesis [Bacteroides luti]
MIVLHLVKTSVGATWALRQMIELVKLGVEVHVALPLDGYLISRYKANGIYVHGLNYSIRGLVQTAINLRKIVKDVKPDIIHSHFVLTTLVMRISLRNMNIPRIFQIPGPLHLENKFFKFIDIYSANKYDYWVGSCNWTNATYESAGISKNRLYLSYYGTDILNKKYENNKLIRTELGIKNDDILVGMIAFMYAPKYFLGQKRGLKGHEDFIDAISLVSKKHPNVHGVCVGGAWGNAINYEQIVINYAKKRTKNIHFLGTRTNVPELYQDLFCVVHPSHSENLGGAGESLLLGIPTIATNIGGFPDIVVNEKTGLLVPPKQPKELAKAINAIIEGKYNLKKISENGKKLVSEMLDVKNTAKTMFDIYHSIMMKNV